MAQGLEPLAAAAGGVFLHGLAAERLQEKLGDAGMLAGDLLVELPGTIRYLRQEVKQP